MSTVEALLLTTVKDENFSGQTGRNSKVFGVVRVYPEVSLSSIRK
jgi:hypothetical protein